MNSTNKGTGNSQLLRHFDFISPMPAMPYLLFAMLPLTLSLLFYATVTSFHALSF